MENKLLITAGCSFSQVPNLDVTWPVHLQKHLGYHAIHLGQGAAGNGVISRKVIYEVTKALKNGIEHQDILVGIMWSGPNRLEIYNTSDIPHFKIEHDADQYRNPIKIASKNYNWYILNSHWDDESTTNFFKNFYDPIYGMILTIEHILRTQWFLKEKKIKYFMTTYAPKTLDKEYSSHVDVKHLYDEINFDHFLPVYNMLDTVLKTPYKFARPNDGHPSTEMHEFFTEKIIMPYLKIKGYID